MKRELPLPRHRRPADIDWRGKGTHLIYPWLLHLFTRVPTLTVKENNDLTFFEASDVPKSAKDTKVSLLCRRLVDQGQIRIIPHLKFSANDFEPGSRRRT